MKAYPIEWHEENYKNSSSYYQRKRRQLEDELKIIEEAEKENEFLLHQIETAKAKGKKSFNSDLFLKEEKGKGKVKDFILSWESSFAETRPNNF